jgi:hypothetical protein
VTENISTGKITSFVQNLLSIFSFRKNQHIGFEAAA